MVASRIWTFFYGSYMNLDVLKEVDFIPERWQVARLYGFDILIQPRANLIRSDQHSVYGVVATGTHPELERLYTYAKGVLGEIYLPQAVMVETLEGMWLPSLCYICPKMDPRPAAKDYVDRIIKPARELGFPDWYIARLESFRPTRE